MEKMQLIVGKQDKESDKKIYQLTEDGKEFLVSLKQVMTDFAEIIQIMLDIND